MELNTLFTEVKTKLQSMFTILQDETQKCKQCYHNISNNIDKYQENCNNIQINQTMTSIKGVDKIALDMLSKDSEKHNSSKNDLIYIIEISITIYNANTKQLSDLSQMIEKQLS